MNDDEKKRVASLVNKIQNAKNAAIMKNSDIQFGKFQDDSSIFSTPSFNVFSVSASGGYEQHTYYDSASFGKLTPYEYPFDLGVSYSRVLKGGTTSISLGYDYVRSYTDGGDAGQQVICQNGANSAIKCINGYFGAPVRTDKEMISGEFRWIGKIGKVPIGFGPKVQYDAVANAYGVQVPVYLVGTGTPKFLTGGVRFDWTSTKKVPVFGVFVASSFCVIPGDTACGAAKSTN